MHTIGLIGGMSWESTSLYYSILNTVVKEELGGLHSAKILLYSVDFHDIEQLQASGDWDGSAKLLGDAACALERGGADFLVICTNTMHKVAPQIQQRTALPLLHIAEATARVLQQHQVRRVGLLGTRYTMQQDFYKGKLAQAGIDVVIPQPADVDIVNAVIYDELCLGTLCDTSRQEYRRIIEDMAGRGAQGVVLGCTEIGLLIQQQHSVLPVFDTTRIHARSAAMRALGKD